MTTQQKNVEPDGNDVVTFNLFGSVKIGMMSAQTSQALGAELVRGKGYEETGYDVDPKVS